MGYIGLKTNRLPRLKDDFTSVKYQLQRAGDHQKVFLHTVVVLL